LDETTATGLIEGVLRNGLMAAALEYEREADGRRVYRGERPGEEWVGHGTFARGLWTLVAGELRRVQVHKQRWRRRGTTETRHSRPPDDLGRVAFCSLVVIAALWGWLDSGQGLHAHESALPALAERPARRTVQRWLQRALPHADETALAMRRAVIERSEPRPMESHIGGGLSPPADRRRWADPSATSKIHSGLCLLLRAAVALAVPVSVLLAEARGRQLIRQTWLI
jgi:hypothetical protein